MNKTTVLREILAFILAEKKYWLAPLLIAFALLGLLLVFSQSSALAPFIYTIF